MCGSLNVLPILRDDSHHNGIHGVNRFLEIAEASNNPDLPLRLQPFSRSEIKGLKKELLRRSALDGTAVADKIERRGRNYRFVEP